MLLRDVMTEAVVTAAPDLPAREVAQLMRQYGVGSVVLVDEGHRPVGFLTDRDLAVRVLATGSDGDGPASECASAPVVMGEADMDVEEAASEMISHAIRRLPVVDGDRLVGILTLDDLVVRAGELRLAQVLTSDITRAALPGF